MSTADALRAVLELCDERETTGAQHPERLPDGQRPPAMLSTDEVRALLARVILR